MTLALPQYQQNEAGRFDFRVPDGLGNYVYLDWDDPDLKVEFRDSQGTLRFTATTSSSPALTKGSDDQGYYHYVEGIDLSEFALGNVEACIYGKVNAAEVEPYPTIIVAFEVISSFGEEPLYTTADRVKAELPEDLPDNLTDALITRYIADQSRNLDAYLRTCYMVPFPGIGDNPPTPELVEQICRKLTLHECLLFLARDNRVTEESPFAKEALSNLGKMIPLNGKAPLIRLEGYLGPLPGYSAEISRQDYPDEDMLI
jgi:hypothetical protein